LAALDATKRTALKSASTSGNYKMEL